MDLLNAFGGGGTLGCLPSKTGGWGGLAGIEGNLKGLGGLVGVSTVGGWGKLGPIGFLGGDLVVIGGAANCCGSGCLTGLVNGS